MSDLLDRLNKLKDDSGMNAKQLTTALGLSSTSFTDWNKGKGSPSLDAVIKFAEYFNVSTDFLILGRDKSVTTTTELDFSSKADKELLAKYHSLSPGLQDKLIAYLDGMLAAMPSASSKEDQKLSV